MRTDRFGLTETERLRIWKQATLAVRDASEQIAANIAGNPAAAADAAWAASDFLAAAGRVVEGRSGGPLTDAAQQYDNAAREMFGRTPTPTAAGTGLRVAGRLLLAAQVAKPSELRQLLALLAQLSALTDAVTRLRETQQRAAQAQAARRAAEQLRDLTAGYRPAQLRWSARPPPRHLGTSARHRWRSRCSQPGAHGARRPDVNLIAPQIDDVSPLLPAMEIAQRRDGSITHWRRGSSLPHRSRPGRTDLDGRTAAARSTGPSTRRPSRATYRR